MKVLQNLYAAFWSLLPIVLAVPIQTNGQTCWDCLIADTIDEHIKMAERYKAGDTNLPVIQIDTFYSLCGRGVSRSGKVSYGCYNGISNWGNHGTDSISQTNLTILKDNINRLPVPPNRIIATNGQVHVSCEQSKKWVHLVYDLDDPPKELERIHELMNVPFYGSKFEKPVTKRNQNQPQ